MKAKVRKTKTKNYLFRKLSKLMFIILAFTYSSCENELELGKVEIEYLIYNELSDEQINFEESLLTKTYDKWKCSRCVKWYESLLW